MSGRTELPNERLLELARQTLCISPTSNLQRSTLPAGYLDELRKHTKFNKHDYNFRVYPQPGCGYGTIKCLEIGCEDVTIALSRRTFVKGGGREEGIGSLSAYRVHVQEHPTHKASCFARIKAESQSQSQSSSRPNSVKSSQQPVRSFCATTASTSSLQRGSEGLWPSVDSGFGNDTLSSTRLRAETRFHKALAQPYDSSINSSSPNSSPLIPRKRHSMSDDTDITVPSSSPHHSSAFVPKKPKLQEGFKAEGGHAPLGMVDPNSPISPGVSNHSSASVTQALLIEANKSIKMTKTLLAHYRRRVRKNPLCQRRLLELETQLGEHEATKARCEVGLEATVDVSKVSNSAPSAGGQQAPEKEDKPFSSHPKASSSNAHIVPFPAPVASGSNVQLPVASALVGGVTNPLRYFDMDVLPKAGLPNYGDTVDIMSDDSSCEGNRRYATHKGPIADHSDINKFLIEAGNSESFDGNESVDKALAKLGLKKLGEHLPFMSISLMPHQVIAVAWMIEHERGSHKGGILADEMGLGKTIATMVQNRSDDPAVKSTLICAPMALLDQWKLEIETKTEGAFNILIYHGPNKPKLKQELQKYDVIITTFQTLALEWPDGRVAERKKKRKKQNKDQDSDDFIDNDSGEEKKTKKKGLLLKMSWFRIVLDEAQNIRNRNTRISLAVTNLDAKHRWCLTGTPVTNSLADCYAFFRFLEIRPWYDWSDFNGHIARIERRRPDLASTRLQAILNSCLIRRKKDSVLDGKKLIELPPKEVVVRKLTFSQDERDIYDAIEKQSQAIINKYLRAGTVLKNYNHVLVLLLRLRQLCSHPCLIQEGGNAFLRPGEDVMVKHEVQTELDRATILAGQEFVAIMKAKLKGIVLQRMAAEKASPDATIEEEECPICFDSLTKPLVTRCSHVFCADCIITVLDQPAVEDGNESRYAMSERPCPTCREPVQREMLFERSAFEPTDADLNSEENSPIVVDDDDGLPIDAASVSVKERSSTKGKRNRKVKKRFSKRILDSDEEYEDPDSDLSDFILQSDEDEEEKDARRELKKKLGKRKQRVVLESEDIEMEDEDALLPPAVVAKRKGKTAERFLPSTKMKDMMDLLKEWAESEATSNEKTMVLSQWTSCLDLIADYLEEHGFTFVRYQGNMTRLARDSAVRTFMAQGKARIMLMSMKCGGVGLNLTRASRVISLDLGWSSAVENQAFDRVHRLGQVRPVTVQRLMIENTVEERILALQERKQNLADGSLGEGKGKKLGRLSVKDLANLFGLDVRDH